MMNLQFILSDLAFRPIHIKMGMTGDEVHLTVNNLDGTGTYFVS